MASLIYEFHEEFLQNLERKENVKDFWKVFCKYEDFLEILII